MKQLGLPGSKSIVFLVAGAIFVAFGVGGVWYREIFPSDWPIALVISALMILLILGPIFIVWWNGTSKLVQRLGNLAAVARAVELGQPRSRVPLNDLPPQLFVLGLALNQSWDKLENAYQQQEKFTSDASHELRTPLAVLRLKAEFALRRERSKEELCESLVVIQDAAKGLQAILDALLLLSRAESGHISAEFREVDLRMIVNQSMEGLSNEFLARGVTLDWVPPKEPLVVRGDLVLLDRIFTNLLSNALRHGLNADLTQPNCVEIRGFRDKTTQIVRIRDFGRGIPESLRGQVFQRFFRVDKGRSRKTGGSGLGLALAQSLAKVHHGQIRLEEISGPGASFVVELPAPIKIERNLGATGLGTS